MIEARKEFAHRGASLDRRERRKLSMAASHPDGERSTSGAGQAQTTPARHALREQDAVWADFLALASSVVDALEKSVQAVCEGRFDLIDDVQNEEEQSDRREVLIEQECLRILALYEPLASDLRRMATVLKVNRDWERIADLALRVARRARKLSRSPCGVAMPEPLKRLARDVLAQVRSCSNALAVVDSALARTVIAGDSTIDRRVPRSSKRIQSPDEPASRAARCLAPALEHRAESRADRRSRGRNRPDHRLSQGGSHHPAHSPADVRRLMMSGPDVDNDATSPIRRTRHAELEACLAPLGLLVCGELYSLGPAVLAQSQGAAGTSKSQGSAVLVRVEGEVPTPLRLDLTGVVAASQADCPGQGPRRERLSVRGGRAV